MQAVESSSAVHLDINNPVESPSEGFFNFRKISVLKLVFGDFSLGDWRKTLFYGAGVISVAAAVMGFVMGVNFIQFGCAAFIFYVAYRRELEFAELKSVAESVVHIESHADAYIEDSRRISGELGASSLEISSGVLKVKMFVEEMCKVKKQLDELKNDPEFRVKKLNIETLQLEVDSLSSSIQLKRQQVERLNATISRLTSTVEEIGEDRRDLGRVAAELNEITNTYANVVQRWGVMTDAIEASNRELTGAGSSSNASLNNVQKTQR